MKAADVNTKIYYKERFAAGERQRRERTYKRKNRRKTQIVQRVLLLIGIVLLVLAAAALAILEIFPVYSSARMEAGTRPDIKEFLRFPQLSAEYAPDSEPYDPNVPGTYELQIKAGLFTHPCTLTIEDTTSPELTTKDLILGREDTYELADFVESVSDITDTTVEFAVAPDPAVKGTQQEIIIRAADTSGNITEKTAHITILPITYRLRVEAGSEAPDIYSFVPDEEIDEELTYIISDMDSIDYYTVGETDIEVMYNGTAYPSKICIVDTQPPVFTMAENFTSFLGDSIKYKAHITVADNSGAYDLQIDTSKVDPNTPGNYEVIYTATDASGNSASAAVTLTIAEKTPNEAELFERVDAILAEITNDSMTLREKAEAIYYYIYYSFYFVDYSNKEDYVIAALDMLNNGQGDCFSFYSIAKVMLTRTGIKNMDISVNNPSSSILHYWNLVDIEDGHGWYHFDTTRWDSEIHVFLWEDSQLAVYNDGRWDYNPDAYPPIA